jgi:hypothetical protein
VSYTNAENPFDVNGDQHVTNSDVLFLISEIRKNGPRRIPANPHQAQTAGYFDVSGDGFISNVDVLMLRSHLRNLRSSQGEGEPPPAGAAANPADSFDSILASIASDVAANWRDRDAEGDEFA